jgi:hypothetical protein
VRVFQQRFGGSGIETAVRITPSLSYKGSARLRYAYCCGRSPAGKTGVIFLSKYFLEFAFFAVALGIHKS